MTAVLAARIGMAAFEQATLAWLGDRGPGLAACFDLAFGELKAVLADGPVVAPARPASSRTA